MNKVFCAWLFAFALLLMPQAAQAKLMFGTDESINHIQDVTLKGSKDETLFLAYKTSMTFFLAGIYVTDDGYVLGVKGDSKRYFNMPTGTQLAAFQKSGLLPDPLPAYSLGAFDYIFGYSLWILLAALGLWGLFKFLRREQTKPDGAAV